VESGGFGRGEPNLDRPEVWRGTAVARRKLGEEDADNQGFCVVLRARGRRWERRTCSLSFEAKWTVISPSCLVYVEVLARNFRRNPLGKGD